MRRKIGSVILVVCILLAWMPDTVMAARMERRPEATATAVQKVSDEDQKETDGDADKSEETEKTDKRNKINKTTSRVVGTIAEGSGSEADPYRIGDAETLRIFADMVNGVGGSANTGICAVLTGNIDLSGVCGAGIGSWTPIGKKAHPYTGTFDGAGFSVNGLYYSDLGGSYAGLFGYNSGVIKNLGVAGGSVEAGSYTGSVCGYNKGTIAGCYNAASVKGGRYTGGVCGNNEGGSVNVCYNTGEVSGEKYVGGVCGYNKNILTDCYNMGTVSGSSTSVGGVCGYNKKQVANCYNTGAVSGKGTDYVGSICGYNHSESSFLNCYYLTTGTENGNYGIAMTRERFAAGEVCWLLNDGKSEGAVWHQTCGQGFPAFGGKTVYQVQAYRESGGTKNLVSWYTNEKSKSGMQTYTAPAAENTGGDSGEDISGNPEEYFEEDFAEHAHGIPSETSDGHVYQKPEWKWKNNCEEAEAVFTCKECGEEKIRKASIKDNTIKFTETDATCVVAGKIVYTASVELNNKAYKGTKTVKTTSKTEHGNNIVSVQGKPATCEEAEVKAGFWQCQACGQYFKDSEGKNPVPEKEVIGRQALGHEYGGEPIDWGWKRWEPGSNTIMVTFRCMHGCGETMEQKGAVKLERPTTEATCKEEGKGTYEAVVENDGNKYTDLKVDVIPKKEHTSDNLNRVSAVEAECEQDGRREHWECRFCGKLFGDAEGSEEIKSEEEIKIPAQGHELRWTGTAYECDNCKKSFTIAQVAEGKINIQSLEDGAVITQEGENHEGAVDQKGKDNVDGDQIKKNDNIVIKPEKEETQDGEAAPGGTPAESVSEKKEEKEEKEENGKNEEILPAGGDDVSDGQTETPEQAGQEKPAEEVKPAEQIGQEKPAEDAGPAEQMGQEKPAENAELAEPTEQEGQPSAESGAPEENDHYGLIYPEGEEVQADPMVSDAWEEGAVNLRVKSSVNGETQEEQEQIGYSMWISIGVLIAFTGIILLCILRRKEN